jgi:hypothetical protein
MSRIVYRGVGCVLVVVCCDEDDAVDVDVDDSDECIDAAVCRVAAVAVDVVVVVVGLSLMHDDGCVCAVGCTRVCCVNDK